MESDNINQPSHYTYGSIECIDYMRDNMSPTMFVGYLEGATKKYLHRWRLKLNQVEDLRKAQWYLNRLIEELEASDVHS